MRWNVANLLRQVVAGMLLICGGKLCCDLPRHVETWNAIDLLLISCTCGREWLDWNWNEKCVAAFRVRGV